MRSPDFFDISSWNKRNDLHTQGTREKFVALDPKGDTYYFKTSSQTPNYPFEFWSEIISSQLGKLLNFPVLEYSIASYNGKIGCLSKSMNSNDNTLTSGYNYVKQYYPEFQFEFKEYHTIDRIIGTL